MNTIVVSDIDPASLDDIKKFHNIIIYDHPDKMDYNNVFKNNNFSLKTDFVDTENMNRVCYYPILHYYKYIYDNYSRLSEYTVFYSGNPQYILDDESIYSTFKKIQYYNDNLKENNISYLPIGNLTSTIHLNSSDDYLQLIPVFNEIYENLFNIKYTNYPINVSNDILCFAVSRKSIISRSRTYYLNIINFLLSSIRKNIISHAEHTFTAVFYMTDKIFTNAPLPLNESYIKLAREYDINKYKLYDFNTDEYILTPITKYGFTKKFALLSFLSNDNDIIKATAGIFNGCINADSFIPIIKKEILETNEDKIETNEDKIETNEDKIETNEDKIETNERLYNCHSIMKGNTPEYCHCSFNHNHT